MNGRFASAAWSLGLFTSIAAFAAGCEAVGSPPGAAPVASGTDGGVALLGITVSPLALTPAFAPNIHDYYVRCAAGPNPVTVSVTDAVGTETMSILLLEDQAMVLQGSYWIRCLPHDFPEITVTPAASGAVPTPGWYLVNGTNYAMVLDTHGTPVWYAYGTNVNDLESPAANVLSFSPNATTPFGWSSASRYQLAFLGSGTTRTLTAVGSPTDSHELRQLPNGDYLILTYTLVPHVDLTGMVALQAKAPLGADETISDCQVQQLDASGQLVWSWNASEHVDAMKESLEPVVNDVNGTSAVDVFHFNSIDVDASGNLLLSARHTNAVYYVDRGTGKVAWKLGGTAYNKDAATVLQVVGDPQGTFNMQHDARLLPDGKISLFDDHGATTTTGVARGVEYAVDTNARTATMTFQFLGLGPSAYEGSFRRYADGNSVIGWGHNPTDPRVMTEVDGNGDVVLDIGLSDRISYRALKVPLDRLDGALLRAAAGSGVQSF
jgi:hypothetical protein